MINLNESSGEELLTVSELFEKINSESDLRGRFEE